MVDSWHLPTLYPHWQAQRDLGNSYNGRVLFFCFLEIGDDSGKESNANIESTQDSRSKMTLLT